MYSGLPTTARHRVQASLAVSWLASAGAGIAALATPLNVVLSELGLFWATVVGVVLFVAAAWAAAGVIFNRYRWEWLASWVSVVAMTPYLIGAWLVVALLGPDRLVGALLATSLAGFYLSRGLLCSAHAAKLRELHQASVAVLESAPTEGDEDDSGGAAHGRG